MDTNEYIGTTKHLEDLVDLIRNVSLSKDEVDVLDIMAEAFMKYRERELQYGGLWKLYGWPDNLLQIRHKAARVIRVFWGGLMKGGADSVSDDLDDAIDLINYTVFFIINKRNRNSGQ